MPLFAKSAGLRFENRSSLFEWRFQKGQNCESQTDDTWVIYFSFFFRARYFLAQPQKLDAAGTYVFERDETVETLPLDLVRVRDNGRLRDRRVFNERRLDLGRAEQVPRHVQHVVYATRDPQVAVRVPLRPCKFVQCRIGNNKGAVPALRPRGYARTSRGRSVS